MTNRVKFIESAIALLFCASRKFEQQINAKTITIPAKNWLSIGIAEAPIGTFSVFIAKQQCSYLDCLSSRSFALEQKSACLYWFKTYIYGHLQSVILKDPETNSKVASSDYYFL